MKIRGQEITGKNKVTLVFPREGKDPIVFVAEAISDLNRMDKYLEAPQPPARTGKGGNVEKDFEDPGYLEQVLNYNIQRMAWIVIESLKPTEIEFELVEEDKPSTWPKYVDEFRDAGLSQVEIQRVGDAVTEANCLNNAKLEAARQVFLRGQEAKANAISGQNT